RQREDHMHVLRRKKFLATLFEPTFASARLTLRAVPISTGVVGDGAMSAARALIEMSAEHGRATLRNGQQHFDVLPADPLTASFDECVSRSANQIGHLERWPVHLLVLWWPVFLEARLLGGFLASIPDHLSGDRCITGMPAIAWKQPCAWLVP